MGTRARTATWLACAGTAALLASAPAGSASAAPGGQAPRPSGPLLTEAARDRRQDRQHILRTIGSRTKDPKVLEKMREKLDGLNDAQLRLAVSLCARIDAGSRSADAALAFSLVTALIVLS